MFLYIFTDGEFKIKKSRHSKNTVKQLKKELQKEKEEKEKAEKLKNETKKEEPTVQRDYSAETLKVIVIILSPDVLCTVNLFCKTYLFPEISITFSMPILLFLLCSWFMFFPFPKQAMLNAQKTMNGAMNLNEEMQKEEIGEKEPGKFNKTEPDMDFVKSK